MEHSLLPSSFKLESEGLGNFPKELEAKKLPSRIILDNSSCCFFCPAALFAAHVLSDGSFEKEKKPEEEAGKENWFGNKSFLSLLIPLRENVRKRAREINQQIFP